MNILFKILEKLILSLYDILLKKYGIKNILIFFLSISLLLLGSYFILNIVILNIYDKIKIIDIATRERDEAVYARMDNTMKLCGKNVFTTWSRVQIVKSYNDIEQVKIKFIDARGWYGPLLEPQSITYMNKELYEKTGIIDPNTFAFFSSQQEFKSVFITKDIANTEGLTWIQKVFSSLKLQDINKIYISLVKYKEDIIWVFTMSRQGDKYLCNPELELENLAKTTKHIIYDINENKTLKYA